jgi:phosphomannomutase
VARFDRYAASGEINSLVSDQQMIMDRVAAAFAGRGDQDRLDGLTISGPDWWVNVRPSNTEPLLRLNVEAANQETMQALRDEALGLIRA